MAFTVPSSEPPLATGLAANDFIESSSVTSLVLRDRFLFATRRRLIASLPLVQTTASTSFQVAYGFQAKTLPTATDTLVIGFTSSAAASVRITAASHTVTLSTSTPKSIIGTLSSIPQDTWFGVTVEVKSLTGAAVFIYGIYIAEQVLTAADLP